MPLTNRIPTSIEPLDVNFRAKAAALVAAGQFSRFGMSEQMITDIIAALVSMQETAFTCGALAAISELQTMVASLEGTNGRLAN